jgi:hypothetical protein
MKVVLILVALLLLAVGGVVVLELPEIRRYLKIKSM